MYCKVQPSQLTSISIACFHLAASAPPMVEAQSGPQTDSSQQLPDINQLIKLSGCGSVVDIYNTEQLICEALSCCAALDVTPLTLLQYFYQLFTLQADGLISTEVLNASSSPHGLTGLTAQLEVLLCHSEFTRFRVSVCVCVFQLLVTERYVHLLALFYLGP